MSDDRRLVHVNGVRSSLRTRFNQLSFALADLDHVPGKGKQISRHSITVQILIENGPLAVELQNARVAGKPLIEAADWAVSQNRIRGIPDPGLWKLPRQSFHPVEVTDQFMAELTTKWLQIHWRAGARIVAGIHLTALRPLWARSCCAWH